MNLHNIPIEHEQIIMAAIKLKSGAVVTLSKPGRHSDIACCINGYGKPGFITSKGRFVTRIQAKKIVLREKPNFQFVESGNSKELYSEDMW